MWWDEHNGAGRIMVKKVLVYSCMLAVCQEGHVCSQSPLQARQRLLLASVLLVGKSCDTFTLPPIEMEPDRRRKEGS